jgi:hypothetical protein
MIGRARADHHASEAVQQGGTAVLALLTLALASTLAGIVGAVPRESGLAFGALLLFTAGLRAGLGRLALGRERSRADRRILAGRRSTDLAWRIDELTSDRERGSLARSLRGLLRTVESHTISASPVNRRAARPLADRIEALAARVSALDRPVEARGVVLVEQLLTDGSGPLYAYTRADELPRCLDDALEALEPR